MSDKLCVATVNLVRYGSCSSHPHPQRCTLAKEKCFDTFLRKSRRSIFILIFALGDHMCFKIRFSFCWTKTSEIKTSSLVSCRSSLQVIYNSDEINKKTLHFLCVFIGKNRFHQAFYLPMKGDIH